MESLCDLFLPVVQSQAVEEHNTWQHAFSDVEGHRSRSKVRVGFSKNSNAVGLISILDRRQFTLGAGGNQRRRQSPASRGTKSFRGHMASVEPETPKE